MSKTAKWFMPLLCIFSIWTIFTPIIRVGNDYTAMVLNLAEFNPFGSFCLVLPIEYCLVFFARWNKRFKQGVYFIGIALSAVSFFSGYNALKEWAFEHYQGALQIEYGLLLFLVLNLCIMFLCVKESFVAKAISKKEEQEEPSLE